MLAILDRASDGHRLMQVNLLLVWWVVALLFGGDMAILENGCRET